MSRFIEIPQRMLTGELDDVLLNYYIWLLVSSENFVNTLFNNTSIRGLLFHFIFITLFVSQKFPTAGKPLITRSV
jgi:hypothetical protein